MVGLVVLRIIRDQNGRPEGDSWADVPDNLWRVGHETCAIVWGTRGRRCCCGRGVVGRRRTACGGSRSRRDLGWCGTRCPRHQSSNWSGYADTQPAIPTPTSQASWTEPSYTCDGNSPESSAVWVGIDGYFGSHTVEQGGTIGICNGKKQGKHMAWWEMYPTNAVQEVFQVKPGDFIFASVTYKAGCTPYNIFVWDGPATSPEHERGVRVYSLRPQLRGVDRGVAELWPAPPRSSRSSQPIMFRQGWQASRQMAPALSASLRSRMSRSR